MTEREPVTRLIVPTAAEGTTRLTVSPRETWNEEKLLIP